MSVKARIQSGKTQAQEVEGQAAKDQKTSPNFQLVNKLGKLSVLVQKTDYSHARDNVSKYTLEYMNNNFLKNTTGVKR